MIPKTPILCLVLLLLTAAVVMPVSADYQPNVEQAAINQDYVNLTPVFYAAFQNEQEWGLPNFLIAIYESSEHHNELLEQQNLLIENQTHAIWVETCYAPHSNYYSDANRSAWESACAEAGYPVG